MFVNVLKLVSVSLVLFLGESRAMGFKEEFEKARRAGKETFTYSVDGKLKNTRREGETKKEWREKLAVTTKDKDVMNRVEALRTADKKLFNQYFGSQFGATTTAAPSADMSAGFGFEDFSFEEID